MAWHVSPHKVLSDKFAVCDERGNVIAVTNTATDATLISTTPDLLAALRRASSLLARYPNHDDAWRQCCSVIAKVDGNQS